MNAISPQHYQQHPSGLHEALADLEDLIEDGDD